MLARCCGAVALSLILVTASDAALRYQAFGPRQVQGSWQHVGPGDFRIHSDAFQVDFDLDSQFDVDLIHSYHPPLESLAPAAVPLVETAHRGATDIRHHLTEARRIALEAGDNLNFPHRLTQLQAALDDQIDVISVIAQSTAYDGRHLLDGSAGMQLIANNPNVQPVLATEDTLEGVVSVLVQTAGERANIEARTPQYWNLAADEELTINGVVISLSAGLTQTEVNSRINEFSLQTKVVADANGRDGRSRLYSFDFGSDQQIEVSSNLLPDTNTSGFDRTTVRDAGRDIVARVDSLTETGRGNFWESTQGSTRGLAMRFATALGPDYHKTVAGPQGAVTIFDEALEFLLHPGQQFVDLSIRSLAPQTLGIGLPANQFAGLNEINVTTADRVVNSIAVIDDSMDSVDRLLETLDLFLDEYVYPQPEGTIAPHSALRLMTRDGTVQLLESGEVVGPNGDFDDGILTSADLVTQSQMPSGFLGVELLIGGQSHYGWLGLEVDSEQGFLVTDAAFETAAGVSVTAGVVPEPTSYHLLLLTLVLGLSIRTQS